MLSTLLFCALCALGAGMVYWHRPGTMTGRDDPHLLWAVTFSALVWALMWTGDSNGFGRRLSLITQELRIPLADAAADGTYFVVGPQPQTSDLVVGPYADRTQSAEVYRPELESLLTIRRDAAQWLACGREVPADKAANLPGMTVLFDGTSVAGEECRPLTAEPLEVLLARRDGTAIAKRRHLYLSLAADHVRIGLKADEYLVTGLDRCADLVNNRAAGDNARLRLAPAGLHDEDMGYRVPRNLVIDQLGQGGDHPLLDPARLGPVGDLGQLCDRTQQDVTWPAADGSARLIMSSQRSTISWWIAALVLMCTLFTARICQVHWREGPGRAEGALVIALQWLLTLRLLVAMSGLPNDANLSLTDVLWPPALALICAPLVAIALMHGRAPQDRGALALLALQLPLGGLLVAWSLDWQLPGMQDMALAGGTLVLLAIRAFVANPQPLPQQAWHLAQWVTGRVIGHQGRPQQGLAAKAQARWPILARLQGPLTIPAHDAASHAGAQLFRRGLMLAIAIIIIRFILAAVGKAAGGDDPIWQERLNGLPVIENLPLSLLYAPLAIVALAMMIAGYRKAASLHAAVLLVAMFALVFIAIAIWVNDLGLILIFALPVAWAIAGLARIRGMDSGGRAALARLILLGPLASPFIILGSYYWWNATPVPAPGEDLAGHMQQAAEWNANVARLQRFVDADYLVTVGNAKALEMIEQAAQLEPITAHPIGRGYMATSGIVRPLLTYQYSDNLLAVHIAWPFGRIGLAVLLFALLLTLLGLRGERPPGERGHWLAQAGNLAAMTVFWSGAYMALANLNLVPFTGRNFYLLAARSMGDLAEGLVLFVMVALPAVVLMAASRAQVDAEAQRP